MRRVTDTFSPGEARMIDIASETLITFSQAAAEQPHRRQGKRVSTVTIWRWTTRGSGGVVLESLKTPSGRVTSRQAVQRFFETLTATRPSPSGPAERAHRTGPRSPARRQRESEK